MIYTTNMFTVDNRGIQCQQFPPLICVTKISISTLGNGNALAASNCEISEGESGKQPKLENKRQNDDAELEEREINQAKYIEECALASN